MSPCISRLFELHLAHGADVVVVLHRQVSICNDFGVILGFLWGLHLLRFYLRLWAWPFSLLIRYDILAFGHEVTPTYKLATMWISHCVPFGFDIEGRIGCERWMVELLLICVVV